MADFSAEWGTHTSPSGVLLAGNSGDGKTSACLRMFGPAVLILEGVPGGSKPAAGLGITIDPARVFPATSWHSALKRVRKWAADGLPFPARGVLFDQSTEPASVSHQRHEASAKAAAGDGKIDGFAVWRATMELLLETRDVLRKLGVHFALNGYLRPPAFDEKQNYHRGGIVVPSRARSDDLAQVFDLSGRLVRGSQGAPPPLWWARLHTNDAPDEYVGRDRHGWAPPVGPANPAEVLRAAGYKMPRGKAIESLGVEGHVEELAQMICADGGELRRAFAAVRAYRERYATGAGGTTYADAHAFAVWVLQDAAARAELRLYRERLLDDPPADVPWTVAGAVAASVDAARLTRTGGASAVGVRAAGGAAVGAAPPAVGTDEV
jgi:hypothetical protein